MVSVQAGRGEVHGQQRGAAGAGGDGGQQDADRRGLGGAGRGAPPLGRAGAARQDRGHAQAEPVRGRDEEHPEDAG